MKVIAKIIFQNKFQVINSDNFLNLLGVKLCPQENLKQTSGSNLKIDMPMGRAQIVHD